MFCPDWVYDIAVARTAHEFLVNDLPLPAISGKYVEGCLSNTLLLKKMN